jgi:hypothetical protein
LGCVGRTVVAPALLRGRWFMAVEILHLYV